MRIFLIGCFVAVLLMSPIAGFAADSDDSAPAKADEISSARTALKVDNFAAAETLLRPLLPRTPRMLTHGICSHIQSANKVG